MHIFHNISFEADIEEANSNIVWEQHMAGFVQDQFLPKLEHVLDEWDKKHPNLQCVIEDIDLEIHLEDFDAKLMSNELVDQFKIQLNLIDVRHPEKTYKLKVQITQKATVFDTFIAYLKTGRLANGYSVKQLKSWIKEKKTFSTEERTQLQQLTVKNNVALQRLYQSFYDESYQELAKILAIDGMINTMLQLEKSFIKAMLQQVHQEIAIPIIAQKIEVWTTTLATSTSIKRYAETFLKLLHTHAKIDVIHIPSIAKLEIGIIQAMLQYKYENVISVTLSDLLTIEFNTSPETQNIAGKSNNAAEIENDSNSTENKMSNDKKSNTSKDEAAISTIEEEKLKTLLAEKGIETHQEHQNKNNKSKEGLKGSHENIAEVQQKSTAKSTTKNTTNQDAEEHRMLSAKEMLSTEKAGLVLVHPFLNILFKELQLLTDNNKITDPEKAAVILHYLATGNTEISDVELALEKIILNIPLEEVISKSIALTNEEKLAADALLAAVLQHWNVLKNSSIEALREMFIKRDGTIRETEKTFTITVERLAQDILLDKLPWGVGMIRFPWKKKFINVEW